MPDITFDDLINAKNAAQPKSEGGILSDLSQDGLMQIGTMALNILQEFKGIQQGKGGVLASRSLTNQTASQQEVNKPMVDIEQVKGALELVKTAKGDITISKMLKLLDENKEAVAGYLKAV